KPKEDRSSAPLIEDWETDSDDGSAFTHEPISAKIDFVKADRMAKKSVLPTNVGKGTGHRNSRPVWNNVQRINHQNKFAPTTVFTRSGRIPVSATKPKAATSTSVAKPVNTAGIKKSVNFSRTKSTFHKSHSPIRRSFYNATSYLRRNSTERVNTVGSKAVSVVKGNRVTSVKTSAGHLHQALKNKGIVDSRCSRYMTGNKAYLADYQEIHDGGFVAFSSSRGPQGTNGNACTQDNVDVRKEVSDQHYIVLPLWSSISSIYKRSDDKPTDDKLADDKPKDDNGSKTVKEPINKEDQAYRDELDRIIKAHFNNMESSTIVSPIPTHKVHIDHPKDQILGHPKSSVQSRGMEKNSSGAHALMEPKKVSQALDDESWVEAMQEELLQFSLQNVKQSEERIFISQDNYVAEILKRFKFSFVKTASTPIETQKPLVKDEVTPKLLHLQTVKRIFWYLKGQPKLGLWYPRDSSFNLEAYSNNDYVRANLDKKSITGGCQFLSGRLISLQYKKQTIVATFTTKAEYVVAAHCCGQVLWIQNQMLDYGFNFMNTKIYVDNESTI
nr:hypothetical protein [Tanacetum cinerariifolium]